MFEILNWHLLNGPNLLADGTCLSISTTVAGGTDALLRPMPAGPGNLANLDQVPGGSEVASLISAACAAIKPGAPVAELLLAIAARLQASFVINETCGRMGGVTDTDFTVIFPCESEHLGMASWKVACQIGAVLLADQPADRKTLQDLTQQRARVVDYGFKYGVDQLSQRIARRAQELDIPVCRPDTDRRELQYGQGRHRRLGFETLLDPAGHFDFELGRDKSATITRLRQMGLPVNPSAVAIDARQAVAIAAKISGPVVLKPLFGGKGRGVSIDLSDEAAIRRAYALAGAEHRKVLVEAMAPGFDHRLLVVGGKLVAAAKRLPAQLIGDGHTAIAALIEELNADPQRGARYEKIMERVEIDRRLHDVLARQSLNLQSVPARDQIVQLSFAANISQGGTAVDVLNHVHPDNGAAAERAARAMGGNITGIDFMTPDISRSWRDVGGAILEVNSPPGLRPHWIANPHQDIVTPILRHAFPPNAPARIPTGAVAGGGKASSETCRMLASIARIAGQVPGVCTAEGAWSGDFQMAATDARDGHTAANLLTDPDIDMGVFAISSRALAQNGLVIDGCDVAAILGGQAQEPGNDGLAPARQLARIKGVLLRNTRKMALLDADDPDLMALRKDRLKCEIGLISMKPGNQELAAHHRAGQCTVAIEYEGAEYEGGEQGTGPSERNMTAAAIIIRQGAGPVLKIPAAGIANARAPETLRHAAFAAAMAHGLGYTDEQIRRGLARWQQDGQ